MNKAIDSDATKTRSDDVARFGISINSNHSIPSSLHSIPSPLRPHALQETQELTNSQKADNVMEHQWDPENKSDHTKDTANVQVHTMDTYTSIPKQQTMPMEHYDPFTSSWNLNEALENTSAVEFGLGN